MIEKYLEQLISDLELDSSSANKNNADFYSLHLSDDIELKIKELSPGLIISSPISECPKTARESLFIYLMKANFLGIGTGGAAIGLDREEKNLTLSRTIPYDINYKSFKEAIEDFTNYLDLWRQEIERHQKVAEEGIL